MDLPMDSFITLFPEKDSASYTFSLRYSKKFSQFNANVRMSGKRISFSLSDSWRHVGDEIKTGLIQDLLCKLFGSRQQTKEMRLYHIFTKKVHIAAHRTNPEPSLLLSYHRVNERLLGGMVDQPNLRFGKHSMRTMGSYNYHTDTITISRLLAGDDELIDYVMYHELLHKKLKFGVRSGRALHHSKEFRSREREYPDAERLEKRLVNLGRRRWF